MNTHVVDTSVVIHRPTVVVYTLQIGLVVVFGWILASLFFSLVGMYEKQHDIIMSGILAFIPCAIIGLVVWCIVRLLDMLWKRALIRSKLKDEPYHYTDISFHRFGKQIEFVTPDDHVVRMNISASDPKSHKGKYYHTYSIMNRH